LTAIAADTLQGFAIEASGRTRSDGCRPSRLVARRADALDLLDLPGGLTQDELVALLATLNAGVEVE
jgi:hypothetical protein